MSKRLQKKIQAQLTPDLLHRKYRHLAAEHPHAGHCYAATEALYHALGAEGSGWRPVNIQWEGSQHWFLQHKKTGKVLDPTAGQFSKPVPYEHGRARGFLTKHPSKRAQEIMKRAKLNESNWFAPDFEKEKGEFERVSRETGIHIDKLKGAFAKGKLAPLSPDHFASLENTDANTGEYKTVDSVHHMAQSYGGKDSHGIHRGLTQGEHLPAPIVLHRKGKSPTLVAGNTRLTMATVMNQPVHAVHINVDESRADQLIKLVLHEGVVLSGEPGSKRLMTVAMQYGYQETGEPEVTKTAVVHKLIDPKTGYQLQVRRLLQRDRGLDLDQNIWQHSPTNDLGTDPEHLTQVLRLATRNARAMA